MKKQTYKIPILFIIFNRPEKTLKVFSMIRKIKPKYLYIAADLPADKKDLLLAVKTRKIVELIDWDCEIKTKFSKKPLGCKYGVSSAINWFFQNVNMGIILEDDCLPSLSFFKYCDQLLNKYKNNNKIMSISGFNPLDNSFFKDNSSYTFSYYGSIWGWATWKRAWNKYELNMKSWNNKSSKDLIKSNLNSNIQYYFRKKNYDLSYESKIDTWDYAWSYSRIVNSGLSIIPKVSLIKNIGFGKDATHTKSLFNPFSKITQREINFPLVHPLKIEVNRKYDSIYFFKLSILSKIYSLINLPIIILRRYLWKPFAPLTHQ